MSGAALKGTDAPGTGAAPRNGTNGATKEEPGKGPLALVLLAPFALGATAGWWGGLTGGGGALRPRSIRPPAPAAVSRLTE